MWEKMNPTNYFNFMGFCVFCAFVAIAYYGIHPLSPIIVDKTNFPLTNWRIDGNLLHNI